ncbi:unnamed protein product [Prorocentrum cordatum]|uniref:Uncharacterized protein n=1 Tax=Prorocentrum cordatum TaxID=2364126 RepID=A0ABN9X8A4_9DINO|nr:unnamed protein product [Polarella glacialis]
MRGVLPGCTDATFLLQLLFQAPLGAVMEDSARTPRSLGACADDLALQIIMIRQDIVKVAAGAPALLADALRELELPVAEHNAKVLAADPPLAKAIACRGREHGFKPVAALSVLGMEVAGGRRLRYSTVKTRSRAAAVRPPRFRRLRGLRAKTFKQVLAPSIGPALTYGLQVTSAPPRIAMRTAACAREGWSETPAASSTWVASMLGPSWRQRPDCMSVAGPIYT